MQLLRKSRLTIGKTTQDLTLQVQKLTRRTTARGGITNKYANILRWKAEEKEEDHCPSILQNGLLDIVRQLGHRQF